MVTLGSIQPATFQAFHGSAPYDNTLNFQSFELALNDVSDLDVPPSTSEPAEEVTSLEPAKPARRSSLVVPPVANRSGPEEAHRSPARPAYTQSSASHRLFRPAEPELKSSWHAHLPTDEGTGIIGPEPSAASRIESRSRASSWHASDMGRRRSPLRAFSQQRKDEGTSLSSTSPACTGRRGREDRPANEILDGSDVLQQISNLTSTEPSNEREVFVGGLRESEDAVHITEEELATYFAKFGVIESVSINRDDRTQRGRGFAFVKFFQEAAALNAVVADASTHVIRGTTVSVQWSRGAKDAGGDRPRRRNSATSATSSNNGCSPSRGSNRSSPKMNMFSHKNGGHRGSGGGGGGGGGGGSCGAGCNHGFSPMRSRSQGHMHASSGAGGGAPYSFCNGGRHGSDHHNQQMVCVVVPAQRAAALGLSQHTTGHLPTGSCSTRGSPPRDSHFAPFIQSSAHGAGGGHSGYSSHTRSHSSAAPLSSSSGHVSVGGGGSGGGGAGYGHRASQGGGEQQHHAMTAPHHVSPKAGRSYGAPPPMQMPPVHHERRGRPEPRGYPPAASGGGGSGGSAGSPFSEYERTKYESPSLSHSNSYTSSDWGVDSVAASRGMAQGMMRSQSPPDAAPSAMSSMSSRNGGGAPRPPPTPPRGYENQYTSTRYAATGPAGQIGRATDGFPPGISMTGRRHSGSSVMSGRNTMRQDAIAAMNCYYVDDMANEYAFDAEYTSTTTTAPSRLT